MLAEGRIDDTEATTFFKRSASFAEERMGGHGKGIRISEEMEDIPSERVRVKKSKKRSFAKAVSRGGGAIKSYNNVTT